MEQEIDIKYEPLAIKPEPPDILDIESDVVVDGPDIVLKALNEESDVFLKSEVDGYEWPKSTTQCDICRNEFESGLELRTHRYTHTENTSFTCIICCKTYSLKQTLSRHIMTIHSIYGKPYECDICHNRFTLRRCLNNHTRIHTGEKPFECETCRKRFKLPQILNNHKRIHTGEKPYECDTCQKRFTLQQHLKMHILTHTDEKPYGCDICQKRFKQQHHLNNHTRIHTDEKHFECETCHKRFKLPQTPNNHKRIHTGEKPYECDICQEIQPTMQSEYTQSYSYR